MAERKSSVPPHTLYSANLLDRLLESVYYKKGGSLTSSLSISDTDLLFLSWPIVGDVVFLDLLRNVIRLRMIRPLVAREEKPSSARFKLTQGHKLLTISIRNRESDR